MAIAAIRHNNPGNVSLPIRGWTGGGSIVGIQGQPGYAHFPDMATGAAALQHRLSTRIDDGYNTIRKLNPIYAEDPNWKNGVSRFSGIGLDEPLTSSNIKQLTGGIIRQETGRSPSSLGVDVASNSDDLPADGPLPMEYVTVDSTNPQTADAGAKPLSFASTAEELKVADLNGDGETTWAEVKEYNAALSATKTTGGAKAGAQGSARNVPTAIVTAGDQQAKATVTAAKTIAAGATADTQASNAANQGIFQGALSWLGGRVLQIMVFILAVIFVLVGLYFFAPKTIAVMQSS